jgi:acetylornithine deacetylase
VNPDLSPGGAGEAAIAGFCSEWLTRRGFDVHRLERRPGRPSIVAVARGSGGGASVMINGHLDVVGVAHYEGEPFQPRVEDGRLYGRGSYDMKAGVAAAMVAAMRATTGGPLAGDVILALVADEEHASFGTEEVLERFTADAGLVVEPTELEIVVAHKGFAWFHVETIGTAAHGSRPDLGVDAIAKAGHFLVELERLGTVLAAGPAHPLLGTGSVHASIIEGGEGASTYPARCRITLERRTIPGEDGDSVEAELTAILDGLAHTVPDFRYRLMRGLDRPPLETGSDSAIFTALRANAAAGLGREPTIRGEAFWTDAALMHDAGIPSVLFGVAGGGAHAVTEWVDLRSLDRLTSILTGTIIDFCSRSPSNPEAT